MTNKEIVQILNKTSKLMTLHGENEFKIRSYNNAIFNLERLSEPIENMSVQEMANINGVGQSIAEKMDEINRTKSLTVLEAYLEKTPDGILELMGIRGIGIQKIKTLLEERHIESKYELKEAIEANDLIGLKGFGAKTIQNIADAINFSIACERKLHYSEAEVISTDIIGHLTDNLPKVEISPVGFLRRQWEVVDKIELLIGSTEFTKLNKALKDLAYVQFTPKLSGPSTWKGEIIDRASIDLIVYLCPENEYYNQLLLLTGSSTHLNFEHKGQTLQGICGTQYFNSEHDIYDALELSYCVPEIREGGWELKAAAEHSLPKLITEQELKGVIHAHSTYSDGQQSLTEMADSCQKLGLEYLGISDHSKAAYFYANGLFEERVRAQHTEIDEINRAMAPFKIFKGIEADILSDGDLDYERSTLETFDFVVASVHSGLNMDIAKATERVITAIANPYTTILGHMTGRLLLHRKGFPIDHEAVIKACAEFNVIIEINAHPFRLDIDWRWVHKALDAGVILSINPDAHSTAGYEHMKYGVITGRKGGLTAEQTLNAWSLERVDAYFKSRKDNLR